MVDVTRITFLSGSPIMKGRLMRRLRKVSVMMSLSFSRTAMADSSSGLFEPVRGMSPIMGTFVSFSTSVRPFNAETEEVQDENDVQGNADADDKGNHIDFFALGRNECRQAWVL